MSFAPYQGRARVSKQIFKTCKIKVNLDLMRKIISTKKYTNNTYLSFFTCFKKYEKILLCKFLFVVFAVYILEYKAWQVS